MLEECCCIRLKTFLSGRLFAAFFRVGLQQIVYDILYFFHIIEIVVVIVVVVVVAFDAFIQNLA